MGLNGKQLLENFKEDEAYGNTTYTPPDDSSDDDNGDNAWKYISAGDISGLVDYTNRNYNYRTIPFLGQIVGHAADAATQGVADAAQFVGAQGVGDYLNEKAQKGEAELPDMSTPELSLAYLTDPNGLASAFGMLTGSMLSTLPVAAIAPELLPARAAMALSKVPKALSAVPKIGGALEEMAPMAGRFALTGPVEAMMEGGNTEREMLQNGATPEEARQAAWNVFGENVGLLTATNALEGGLLGKIKIKTPHFSNPVVNTASRVAGYVPTTAAEMALQGYEEGAQQGIQNGVEGESPNTANQILNPFAWTDDQWDAAKLGLAGAVPLMGAMGAIRHFGNRGDNGSTAADSLLDQAQDDIDSITSQTAQQSVIQSAQQDMENNPYTAPTAMQDTPYEAPSDTSDTSSGSSYDASALEGDPQYTVSGEVSSTDVTPLTDQKMRLLDAAYYNKYGQHLFVTSMKRNGDGGSWHDSGQAFDTADDNLENNKEARDWLISEGEKLGLTPLDEYEHPSANATGGHIHFSDHGEPIPDGIRVGESDSDMDDSDMDDSTGGVDLSNLPVGDIAMAIAQNTNLPVNFIWSQLSHESDGGKSKLAVEDHNYGGVKGTDGNYLHFDNDQQFIDYMSKYYPKYREDGIYDAKTADQFAEALQHGGYFTADLGEYEGGMHRYLEQAGLSQDAMFGGKARRASRKGGDNTSSTPDLSGSFEISADDPAMDSMFASFAKDWQNMSTDANEINFFGDMFNSRNKFKATEENKQAILDNYGDAFRQYVQENQPQTVQAAQTAQAPAQPKQVPQPQHIEMQTPNLQTITTPKVEATTIQNVLSSFVQDKKNVARTEQEANLFDDMLDADDHFIDTPKNRQTLLKNYGAQLQDYVDDAMTPSLTDRVNQAIEQAVQNKDLNRMNTLTQAKQANDTAALEKLVGPQTKQHVDIAAMLTPANTDMKNPVSSTVQANAPVYQTATMEHQAPQTEVASTVQGNVPVNQVAATEDEQKAFRKAGLVYRDSNYNGTERVKTAPLYEEGDRRMNGGKSETKVKAQTAGKADKYKKDAEKIYLRFKSGKFSTEDSIKQLNNLKKKATSDKALSDEDRADVIAEADKHINRIKPQKETKEHETQKHNSKTAKTTQSGEAEGYPHQDAKPEPRKAADTQREAEESEVSTTKKAADKGGKYVLADGYRTESGKPLSEADEKEFILKPDGSKDFGEITASISKAAKERHNVELAPGKICLRVGNDKEGLIHAKKHEEQAKADGYASIEDMIADVAENFDAIYERPAKKTGDRPTYSLIKYGDKKKDKMNGTAPVYFDLENDGSGNYYLVITAIPTGDKSLARQTKKDRLIYSNPGLGVATTSNSSAVSRPRSENVGATKGVRPTSDKSSGPSTHIIPHEQKEGTKNLDTGKVPGGLSKEAQGVYIAVRDKLHTSKSKARRAADVSAEILARHADTYAKAYSKATGKKYTAADYMRDKIGIDTDGNVVNDEKAKQFFQKAWHGSPHDFDRFDLGAIGTGEGAQVHGWGLYFAANREVSEGYIERLSDVIGHEIAKDGSIVQKSDEEWATIDNAPIDENTPPLVIALKLLREVRAKGNYNIGDAIQKLQWQYIQRMEDDIVASDFLTKWYKKFKYRNTLKNLKAAEQILKEGKYDFKNITSGHLFEVEIPEADTMLDEQLSYSEQPKMVQKAIDALYADRKKLAKEWKNLSAEDFKEIYHPSGEAWTYFMEWNRLRSLNWAFNAFTREDIGNFLRETSSKNHYPESKIREIENSEQAYNKARNDVRHALANTESYLSKMVERVGVSEDYHDMNGREIYQDYMNALMMYHNISRGWASKNTALALREHGVNGVSYVGGRDGRCYVTFDDKTVKIINKYNQMLNGAAQGYTSALSDGKRVVTLLDGADESTFLHEMGHVFLLDLQDLAEIDQTAANDMAAVEGWTTWKKGQAKEYKGTAWEQEFADRENAIVKAMVDGDEETVNQLKDEWAQERFARGLERYLESGEAPSSKLKDVFEKFKQFLTHIYNAFKGEGGKPSEDVQNVMARMMDSDVENTVKVPPMGKAIIGRTGKETTVTTDSGKTIRVRYRLVPTARVITSHNAETMAANKAYPQELQPRDRQRVSMMEQVTTMANELRPADLGAGRNLNQGAPIIRKDGVVLNGNGRAMAIQKATAAGGDKATAYRKYIFEHSKEFGISRSNLSQMRKYMLVREVVDDIDADTMQDIIGSTAGGSRMGASEQAKADAKKIKPRDLERYVDNEQGDLTTAANRDFVASVLYRIVGKNERNAYTDEHGNVNADGIQRVKRAFFSLAYNDDGLIDKMAESTDDNIRNVSRGLMNAAPAFARVNLAVADGQAYPYNADKTVSEAVKRLDALRSEGKPVKDYLNEQSMFSEYQDTDEMREVLRFFDENKRSGKRIGIFLNDMARSILEQGSPNQTSLMDGGRATLGEIIKAAERVARDGTTAASLFGNEEGSHVDVARSKASVQGDLKKIGKRVVFLPDNSLTSREKGIKEFGEKMGLKVVFFEGPSNLHGMYENGVSFINRSSSTSAPWTFWHETFHWLRHNNPELYRQMVSYIGKKQAFSSEQLQAYRDKTGRQALSDADVIEEMLADAMPDVHKRVSLFRNLGKADAPLLQRFVGWLRDAMRAFHDALTGRKAGLSETQKAAMRDALANIAADLRDSNGKHIFKVSGAEREITAADGTKLSYPARFSGKQETPTIFTAEDRLKADKKAWKGTLRKAWKGDMPDTTMLPVMQTPLVLKLVGAPDYPMVMRQSKLMKIKKDHPEVTKAILNELPSYLADPMIIFKSSTVSGRLVVGTELEDASGANIIVPIELNSKDGRMDVNVITSVYGKGTQQSGTNIAWFVNNIQAGNAVYINKKQAADFYQSAGLQLPMEGRRFNDLFGSSIKTDADLVKSRRENPVRYSLDANDNSTPSLFTRAYNHLTGRKDAASHDKNVKAMLEDITKMRIRFGKLDPATEIVFKKFEGVIRARNANEWEKVLPEAGRAIADRLNLKPSEDMNNYIAKWLLDEATNDTSQEASDFAAALKNDPVLSDQLVDLKTLFNERNNREADEVVRDAIQYEKPKERTTLTKAWETFYDEMIEELGPVKRMVKRVQEKSGQELAASVNPYIALRLFRGNAGRAMTMIEGQSEVAVKALQTNYPGVNFNGFKTLHMILDECGALHNEKRMKDFLAFALACHIKDIHTLNNRIRKSQQRLRDKIADLNDKINNLPEYQQLIESDKKVDDKHQEQREAYQKEIEGYQAKIDKAEKTIMEVPRTEDGLSLTEDRCNKVMMKYMKEYGEAQQDLVHFSKVTTSILYNAGVISKKRYKELQERWPNYIPMFRVFEDNEEVDFGDSLKHMHGSTRRIINPLDSVIRNTYDFVKKAEKNKARQLLADLTRISDVGEYIEEVDNSKPNDKTTITFYENGERKYLQTDPDIVKAVNNMGREESNWVLRLLHGPAKIARACFTTINPSFALRNLIRDSTDATIYSKYGFKPWDFVRGFLHAVHRDELFYEWLSSGAAQASAISLDRDYTQATLNQMSKTWKERLLSKEFLPAILEGMQMVGEYSEYGTRIAAYERVKKTLAGENGPHPAAYDLVSAAFESRDLMDFARGGRGSRYLNNVVVFANASIQGFDKFFRTFDFRKPYRKESMKALARLFLCGMLPALLLAGIHSGDDWWEELPDWQKETNWILGKVGNTIIRIPKGQDIGLRFFSNLIEKAMDRSKHKAGDYFKPVWDSLPDMIPTALLPIIEATANHSYFTGAPVVPKYQEKLPAYLQFGNETSSFAKFVGKVIGVSPRKVEHVLFGYTGNMGKGLLGVYDTIVGNQSLNTNLNEAPVISGFTAIPYKQSKTVNDFYDKFDEQQRLNEEFKLTKKKPDGYDPALYKRMTKAQQELSKINKQERAAIDDPKMDSGVREQKQLGYQQQRLSVVRRVMGH